MSCPEGHSLCWALQAGAYAQCALCSGISELTLTSLPASAGRPGGSCLLFVHGCFQQRLLSWGFASPCLCCHSNQRSSERWRGRPGSRLWHSRPQTVGGGGRRTQRSWGHRQQTLAKAPLTLTEPLPIGTSTPLSCLDLLEPFAEWGRIRSSEQRLRSQQEILGGKPGPPLPPVAV